jgi:hypothetical protein
LVEPKKVLSLQQQIKTLMKKNLQIEMTKRQTLISSIIFCLNQATGFDDASDLMIERAIAMATSVAKLNIIERFKDYPWVIKQNRTNPTYYQQVSVIGEVVTLSRMGKTCTINYKTYIQEFKVATEDEIIQHLNYLNLSNRPYLQKVVVQDMSGSVSATSHNEQPIKAIKPADADFYCVTLKQGRGCTQYHGTYEQAEKEATRLSKQEKKKAYVLGVVGEVEVVPTTTYETKINKY